MTAKGSVAGEHTVQLDVHILSRDYKVACKEHERADLLEAVAFLDKRMREIREGGKTAAVDRIAVMAALNIANELLRERKTAPAASLDIDGAVARRRIQSMHAAIDQALAGQEKLF
jgi:cell division protein ZapA